ncbi:MAG TPA: amino acid adenylation domain-containing protein, partial [Thermoanaerobaculia bacterium]|nr:amino acid adenylation domain-containing protein [Thermoanaerobaculia bacterium]
CLRIDVPAEWDASDAPLEPAGGAAPGNLAYLIYTSGSTGRPKGVAIEHRSASAMVTWALGLFAESEIARVLASTSINFDLSVYEIFVPLARGGAVEVVENGLAMPSEPGVTLVNTVPSVLSEVLRAGGLPPTVGTVNLAGEPLRRGLVERIYAAGPVERVYNLYGPSEDTTYSTWARIDRDDPSAPSIGRPILGTQAYVVDRELRLVPLGTAGELLLGGEGLARGYLGRPDLTAERFVPDPFGALPGGRLYRTGDLSRAFLDGRLEFLGRFDHQVKVRGFRVELGEIEAALARHPGVREAVVTAPFDREGERRLVAYFVPRDSETGGPSLAELREHLEAVLPPAMVPRTFMPLPAMPRTPNGKIDRAALPLPSEARPDLAQAYVAPRTPAEELMAGLFGAVLGVDRVGAFDGFFDLGGHSLSATQLVSRVRRSFGVELPLAELFRSSTPAALAQRVGAALASGQGADLAPPIVPVPREGPLPVSFGQERLWFLDQLVPGNPAYHIPVSLALTGRLDVPALARSLVVVVERHESLRTRFALVQGGPAQVVEPPGSFPGPLLPVIDLTALPVAPRARLARRLANFELTRPFDLARGPVLRAALLRLAPEEHQALFAMHHIASDGWSMGVLVGEVAELYAAEVEGRRPELPELPVQYADFAVWQRGWMEGERLGRQLDFWRGELAGLPAVLELPWDRPRPPVQSFRGGVRQVRLPADLGAGLEPFARRQGATLFMVLLAGFQALLARYSGQGEIAVGAPIAGRTRQETEPLIGLFINTLVLRASLDGGTSFAGLLGQARERSLAAFAHQDLPFERLVDALGVERSRAFNPVFQVSLVLQNTPQEALALPGLEVRGAGFDENSVQFDLQLGLEMRDGSLFGSLRFATALFDAPTAERLVTHFEALLAAGLDTPELRIAELPLLRQPEIHHLIAEWNDPQAAFPAGRALHRRFEEQAARRPEAAAVVHGGAVLSYGDLNRRANQVARRLRTLGVIPGDRVGLCLDRGADLIAGLLGILKAGAAYLPLDPAYPEERLAFMLADGGVRAVVAAEAFVERLGGLPAVWLDDSAALDVESGENLDGPDLSQAVAYVIYTSGSTGRPKGVEVSHAQVDRLFAATGAWFGFGERDVWTLFHSFAFDFSVWEIWGALLYGGRLVVVPLDTSRSPVEFLGLLRGEGVTVLNQTPSAFRQLLAEAAAAGFSGLEQLRFVIFGGEALDIPSLEPWFARFGADPAAPALINMYGITETTVHVTFRPVQAADLRRPGSPIGVPIPDLQVHLVDAAGNLVPLGVAGEMLIGGGGVARGYLGRPDLNAERFLPDPWSGAPGARLYRSGDLARRRAGGELEYLGRIDQQVKIRGFRIELGEIEAALAEQPQVRQAVVVVRTDSAAGARLVAYVVPAPAAGETWLADLRGALERRLPGYMVPSLFVPLEALPVTPSGKVDRRAL